MEKVTLNVSGMSCGHCVNSIEGNVGKMHGVEFVKVDLAKAQVTVEFNNEMRKLDEIKEVIEDQGYEVE